jgi:hypothetical protein
MLKVKIFSGETADSLETEINKWLGQFREGYLIEVYEIKYSTHPRCTYGTTHSALIYYFEEERK